MSDEKFIQELKKSILNILTKENKMRSLPLLIKNLSDQSAAYTAESRVKVFTARPLSAKLKIKLENILKKKGLRSFMIEEKIDPSMIGGIRIIIGDKMIDGSVKRAIDKLSQK